MNLSRDPGERMKEERFMRRIVCCLLAALFLAAPAAHVSPESADLEVAIEN